MNKTSIVTLSDYCDVSSGQGAPQDPASFSKTDGRPFIRAGSLEFLINGGAEEDLEKITDEAASAHRMKIYPPGTVVFAKSGMSATLGRVYMLKGYCYVVSHLATLIPTEGLDSRYLLRWWEANPPSRLIANEAYPSIKISEIGNVKLLLPSLEKQLHIAKSLESARALQTKRREAIDKIHTLIQSVFIHMFGEPITNPMKWEESNIDEVSLLITDGEHQTPRRTAHGIKLLSARNIKNGYLDFSDVDYIDEDEYKRISKRCDPSVGDVLISCSGTIGRVSSVDVSERLSLVRSVALVRPNPIKIQSKFLEYYLRTPQLYLKMLQSSKSSSQANLFQGPIRKLPIYIPPIEKQEEFKFKVSNLEVLVGHLELASKLENELYESIRQRAFEGERDAR